MGQAQAEGLFQLASDLEFRTTTMPEYEHRCSCQREAVAPAAATADLAAWLAAHLQRERTLTNKSVGEAISQLLEKEREEYRQQLSTEIRELKIELTNLEITLSELRAVMASERAQAIDMPSPLTRSRTN